MRLGFVLIVSLLTLALISQRGAAEPPAGVDWVQTFADDFSGGVLKDDTWTIGRPRSVFEPTPEDVSEALLSDGALHLVTRHHEGSPREWTSGSISPRHFRQTYGYLEVRMRFARATGLSNLIVLASDGGFRTPRVEIVVVDGQYPNHIILNLRQPGGHFNTLLYSVNTIDYSADFHLYGLSWLPNGKGAVHLVWYFDNHPVHQADCAACGQAMRLWLGTNVTTWTGPFAPVADGASMDVDYVRVYQDRSLLVQQGPTE